MAKSIYMMICDALRDGAEIGSVELPDDASDAGNGMKFAPGAADGICLYHMQLTDQSAEQAKAMARAVKAASEGDHKKAEALFYEWARGGNVVMGSDALCEYVMEHSDRLDASNIYRTACALMFDSAHVSCVKAGMVLLELFDDIDEIVKEAMRRLGSHEEFTLFAVWNMRKWQNGNEEIFALAKKVKDWGRVHAVNYLLPKTDEIRRWLLFEAVSGDTLAADYSALVCWKKSEAEKLLFSGPTREEYRAIGRLISLLMDEGPVPGMSSIENDVDILLRFLKVSGGFELTPDERGVIEEIKEWAEGGEYPVVDVLKECERLFSKNG
ncbi:MAG: hypothetical protein IKD89_04315 [Clostridia bacterium]|nr:hypothetical protein [Clostridia bacterium]